MEGSKSPKGVRKGMYVDLRSQHRLIRLKDFEDCVEYQDRLEDDDRYTRSIKTLKAEQRERSQSRRVGREARDEED